MIVLSCEKITNVDVFAYFLPTSELFFDIHRTNFLTKGLSAKFRIVCYILSRRITLSTGIEYGWGVGGLEMLPMKFVRIFKKAGLKRGLAGGD